MRTNWIGNISVCDIVILIVIVGVEPLIRPVNLAVDAAETIELRVGFLPQLSGKGRNRYYTGAFLTAIRHLNKGATTGSGRPRFVPVIHVNKNGDELESIRGMTEQYNNGTIVFIGPEDTCTIEANIATAWNLPMIAFVSIHVQYVAVFSGDTGSDGIIICMHC